MGKGNIELRRGCSLTAYFIKGNKKLKLSLKDDALEDLKVTFSTEKSEKTTLSLLKKPVQELFDIIAE